MQRDIIIADWSGEIFRQAKDSVDVIRGLNVLAKCTNLTILIDGEKIVSKDERQIARTDALMLLRSCLDSNMLQQPIRIEVVFTKADIFRNGSRSGADTFIKQTKEQCHRSFAGGSPQGQLFL